MHERIRAAIRKRVEEEPFARKLGIRLIDLAEGYAVVEMACSTEMGNIFDMVHGGAIFTLIDEAFQLACNSHGTVAVALNVNVTYHRAPSPQSALRAEAKEITKTRRTGSYYITVKDGEGHLIASCQALAYRKGEELPFIQQ